MTCAIKIKSFKDQLGLKVTTTTNSLEVLKF